jgi:hypothetical protein
LLGEESESAEDPSDDEAEVDFGYRALGTAYLDDNVAVGPPDDI